MRRRWRPRGLVSYREISASPTFIQEADLKTDDHVLIAYEIKTADGWKRLTVTIHIEREVMENRFRCWEKSGAKSFKDWLR